MTGKRPAAGSGAALSRTQKSGGTERLGGFHRESPSPRMGAGDVGLWGLGAGKKLSGTRRDIASGYIPHLGAPRSPSSLLPRENATQCFPLYMLLPLVPLTVSFATLLYPSIPLHLPVYWSTACSPPSYLNLLCPAAMPKSLTCLRGACRSLVTHVPSSDTQHDNNESNGLHGHYGDIPVGEKRARNLGRLNEKDILTLCMNKSNH
ncbi:hypothetical protein C8Q70DRAFT_457180 [Cubamyces menziesii]|nr:hypothetical protein C8Q70DRAFT_457180 [Cubamyces menziesii]